MHARQKLETTLELDMENEQNPETYSHPGQPVRHSYPLAIQKAGVGTALGLLRKTLPYALVRFGILVAFSLCSVLWWGGTIGGGTYLLSRENFFTTILGWGWFIAGAGGYGYLWYTVLRYFLYLIKAGHIAVLTELITKNEVANGEKNMFVYGKDIVTSRFAEINVLFGLDLLIAGVVRAFNGTLNFIGGMLPIPGLKNLTKVIGVVVKAMTTYIDETIFSYNLARGDNNPWRSGRDGLVYYAQNSMEILKTSVGIVLLEKVLVLVIWLAFFLPMIAFVRLMGDPSALVGFVVFFAFLMAWNFDKAFLHPLFLIMIMTKFHVCAKGQAIDETWDARLEKASGKFRKIKDGIKEWKPSGPAPSPVAAEGPADEPAAPSPEPPAPAPEPPAPPPEPPAPTPEPEPPAPTPKSAEPPPVSDAPPPKDPPPPPEST
ncbi:MAG: hypothetical protein JJU29_01625 [Verrucomicrobia bacterium]|nr:hypothetical protein [Verrucomicrobiota bacterium]MCH8512806.1 hypothetical protein [Kiritimatiellia bacterium]